ncbi:mannose-6-phosphate isomerase, class I [Candidatus Poriferisocius sp.]|uniref:mannose-6-phosphate isomerase, class I n=1 Tax=Candidatus Poriferisocius sp. TaxID=3101276 RepID=UPI003B5BB70A
MSGPGLLHGVVQPYAWGSTEALARIMGVPPSGEPQAELWLGTHPRGPSVLRRHGQDHPLDQVIAADPIGELGPEVVGSFGGELPFLLKILAVAQPLSLQAHPSRRQAQAGFAAENEQGLAADAERRSFRDRNHKPELICALEPFTAFCGFRPPDSAADVLDSLGVPGLAPAVARLRAGDTDGALRWLLERPRATAAEIARRVVASCGSPGPFPEERRWAGRIGEHHPGDIGVVIALLLHLVRLEPGHALFLAPGNLHVYLRGVAVEIMANSDNVLRAGLTRKHVDVPAFLEVVDCRPTEVAVLVPDGPIHPFAPPVPDFRLTRMEVNRRVRCEPNGPEIVLCASGHLTVAGQEVPPGQAAWLPAGTGPYEVAGSGLAFRAGALSI